MRVQTADFDIAAEMAALCGADHELGAIASFVGKVRATSHGAKLTAMTLEHYPGMTEAELERIEADAVRRFRLNGARIVHRVGELRPGDNIVLVITCAPHRHDAFHGCEYLMDYLKTKAPFWKKETLADGTQHWVDARDSDDAALARWQS